MKVRMNGPGRARALGRVAVIAAAAATLLAGCSTPYSYAKQARQAQRFTPNKRPWFCNSVGNGTPASGHGNGSHVHPIYEGRTKGPLSWDDCTKLAAELDKTLAAVKGLETKAKGEAAGWRQVASYIPGLGTHHAKLPAGVGPPGSIPPGSTPPGSGPRVSMPTGTIPGGLDFQAIGRCLTEHGVNLSGGVPDFSDPAFAAAAQACGLPGIGSGGGMVPGFGGPFDPASPQFLIYGGPDPDAPLVGVAFAFFGGGNPPEAYTGGNDWWHLHTKVCFGSNGTVLAGAEEVSDEQCTALGGRNRSIGAPGGSPTGPAGATGIWLLHVWMAPPYEYKPDIFVSGHNCLLAAGVAPQSDPCWKIAHRDPSLGPPPTTAGGGGDPAHDGGHDH
jgi:hypothetical protein